MEPEDQDIINFMRLMYYIKEMHFENELNMLLHDLDIDPYF